MQQIEVSEWTPVLLKDLSNKHSLAMTISDFVLIIGRTHRADRDNQYGAAPGREVMVATLIRGDNSARLACFPISRSRDVFCTIKVVSCTGDREFVQWLMDSMRQESDCGQAVMSAAATTYLVWKRMPYEPS